MQKPRDSIEWGDRTPFNGLSRGVSQSHFATIAIPQIVENCREAASYIDSDLDVQCVLARMRFKMETVRRVCQSPASLPLIPFAVIPLTPLHRQDLLAYVVECLEWCRLFPSDDSNATKLQAIRGRVKRALAERTALVKLRPMTAMLHTMEAIEERYAMALQFLRVKIDVAPPDDPPSEVIEPHYRERYACTNRCLAFIFQTMTLLKSIRHEPGIPPIPQIPDKIAAICSEAPDLVPGEKRRRMRAGCMGVQPDGFTEDDFWWGEGSVTSHESARTLLEAIGKWIEEFRVKIGESQEENAQNNSEAISPDVKDLIQQAVQDAITKLLPPGPLQWPPTAGWGFTPAAVSLNGQCVTARLLVSNVLKVLARYSRRNRAATYEDFRREVWGETDATEKTIQNTLSEARAALKLLRARLGLSAMKDPIPNLGDNAGWKLPGDMVFDISPSFS